MKHPFSGGSFTVKQGVFLYHTEPPLLLLDLESERGEDEWTMTSWYMIDLQKGVQKAQEHQWGYRSILGISRNHVWSKDSKNGILGLGIHDFSKKYNIDDIILEHKELKGIVKDIYLDGKNDTFYVYTLKDRAYELHVPKQKLIELNKTKTKFEPSYLQGLKQEQRIHYGEIEKSVFPVTESGDKTLEVEFVLDNYTHKRIMFDSFDFLITHQDLLGDRGKIILSRVKDQQSIWTLTQEDLFDNPRVIRRLRSSSMMNDILYLVFSPEEEAGDIDIIALDATSGTELWSLVID